MVPATDFRIDEIRWLLERDVEGDLGRRSTIGGQLDAIERGCSIPSEGTGEPGDRALAAVARERAIREAFARLDPLHSRILLAAYSPRPTEEVRCLADIDPEFAADGLQTRTDTAGLLPELLAMCAGPLLAEEYDRRGVTVSPVDWLRQLCATARRRSGRESARARKLCRELAEDARARLALALEAYGDARAGRTRRVVKLERVERRRPKVRAHTGRMWTLRELASAKGVSARAARKAFDDGRLPGAERSRRGRTATVLVPGCCAVAYRNGDVCAGRGET